MAAAGWAILFAVWWVDDYAHSALSFSIWYLLAVAFLARFAGLGAALTGALFGAGLLLVEELRSPAPPAGIVAWNTLSRLAVFILTAMVVNAWARGREELESRVATRTAALREEVARRRHTEAELRESLVRFAAIAENASEVFWLADPSANRVEYVSPAFERVFGRRREEIYADRSRFLEMVHPEDQKAFASAVAALERTSQSEVEYRITHVDGSIHWIRDRLLAVPGPGGPTSRLAGFAQDVTAQRREREPMKGDE